MDKYIDHIISRLDKIDDSVHNIDKTLGRQEEQIAYHIKRTDLLEAEVQPIKKHVNMVSGVLKFIGIAATLSGMAAAATVILTYVRK